MTTIALRYRRVSSIGQEDNSSLDKQLERMDEYCILQGYETTDDDLFTEVMTGVETWRERKELQKLLARVEALAKHRDIVVVVDHPDRFARGLDLILLVEQISYLNARVEFVQTKFQDDDIGRIVLHLESYSSKREWQRIKKRTHDGVVDRVVKDHKLLGSIPLYGYKWDDPSPKAKNCYVYNDDIIHTDRNGTQWSERKVVAFFFQKVKEGMTLHKIAQALNDLGVPTRKRFGNNIWTGARISEMLADPKYMGKYYAFTENYTRNGDKYTRTKKPLEECVLMPDGICPPIVDEETWNIVQAQLEYNKRNSIRNARFPEAALCRNGYARCGYCGGGMNVRTDTSRESSSRYFCIRAAAKKGCLEYNTISTYIVDDAVWRRCCEIIRDPLKMRGAIEELRTPDPTENQSIPLAIRKKQVEEEIENLVDTLPGSKSETGRKRIQALLRIAEEELEELEKKEKVLEGIKKNWQQAEDEIKKFEQWCVGMRQNLENATYSQKRTCIEFLGVRVRIWKLGSRPRMKIDFAPPKILDALAGMEKNDKLTSRTQSRTGITQPYPTLH